MPETVEGATRLYPAQVAPGPQGVLPGRHGPPGARVKGEPFYNPGMALNRDLSVLLVEAFARQAGREVDVADALAGIGARSLRLANEVRSPIIVHHNDADPAARAAARQGQIANQVPHGRWLESHGDAHAFLAARRYDVVDLDPCGSPAAFLDGAVRATRKGGLVCVTATDTAALCGVYPRACLRRYGAHHGVHAAPWRAEVGLRILAGALVRSAARQERGATPVLSVALGHWMRVVVRIEEGAGRADAALAGLGNVGLQENGFSRTGTGAFPERAWAGPLWLGPLHDGQAVAAMAEAAVGKALARGDAVGTLLPTLREEADAPPFWFVPDLLQKRLGRPPRRDVLIAQLRDKGFRASRSHMDPQGIRTDAAYLEVARAWPLAGGAHVPERPPPVHG